MKALNKDILSYAIEDAIDLRIKGIEQKENKDESDLFILETLNRAKTAFESLCIRGLSLYGFTFEEFVKQVDEKSSIVFMSDELYEDFLLFKEYTVDRYKKAKQIAEILEEKGE